MPLNQIFVIVYSFSESHPKYGFNIILQCNLKISLFRKPSYTGCFSLDSFFLTLINKSTLEKLMKIQTYFIVHSKDYCLIKIYRDIVIMKVVNKW